ncbi:MAG: molecular chaperone GrpE [Jaaginema sp. PMC 1079.18]|nr:molecular chaperone GrpE [Jaaginema sp. PMC 1080.18]MEC4849392.1 molecular chaperone GrpE [Jaaginema sp. PMC 1079.18]MEC4865425.1 molecular chaperone GrpE [Jaaginema sp. PMC 1078.18]
MQHTDYFWFGLLMWLSGTSAIFYLWGQQRQENKALPSSFPNSEGDRVTALESECRRLRQELAECTAKSQQDWQKASFEQLESLLISFPTAQMMAEKKPTLPAKNLTALFDPLANLIASWGYEQIGEPWLQVSYDPQVHQPDTADIQPGEMVYIRFIGYRDRDRILCPAKVSRTLPFE